ncbi:hypothetical protein ACHAP5_008712 [Fusarium lateritium]
MTSMSALNGPGIPLLSQTIIGQVRLGFAFAPVINLGIGFFKLSVSSTKALQVRYFQTQHVPPNNPSERVRAEKLPYKIYGYIPTSFSSASGFSLPTMDVDVDGDDQAKSTRVGYKKSRNGCTRCKKRRVKARQLSWD